MRVRNGSMLQMEGPNFNAVIFTISNIDGIFYFGNAIQQEDAMLYGGISVGITGGCKLFQCQKRKMIRA